MNDVDMLRGPLARPMLMFALPLIASGVLQQSFNSVDVAVVGRYAGSDALAAVGSNGPVIGLLINMFVGIGVGVNVVIANCIGSGDRAGVRASVASAVWLAIASGIFMLTVTLGVASPILSALGTPESVLPHAVDYLRIYAVGMPFMIIFNFASAILRSVGDTKRPFYSLVASGIVNLLLNLLFVIRFGMGVSGVAWATVISSVVNAAIVTVILLREKSDIGLRLKELRPSWNRVRKICAVGIPAGLQSTVFSISNIFILSAINSFGAKAAAGSAAAINYEMYCYFVIASFASTVVAFTSQNFGAGNIERCHRILKIGLIYSVFISVVLNVLIAWQYEMFLWPFTDEPDVAAYGAVRLTTVLIFQFVACYYEMTGSSMRGMGYSMTPALITIFGTCVLRLFWVWTLPADATFSRLLAVYPVSWLLTDAIMYVAYRRISTALSFKLKITT